MILAPKNVDTAHTVTHISLCAGYGGIDLGLKRAIPNLRTIAFSEIEAFACANLVSKMEAGLLDPAPIWTNLKTFPWSEFCDRVDILSGGYPCQPFSAAGKRQGTEDPRHLWPFISAGIALMRPRCCFFENVEGHISLGLPDVIEDLAGMGYRTTWGIFSASEVGAPHQRKRVFILAHRNGERGQLPDWRRLAAEQVSVGYGEARRTGVADSTRGQFGQQCGAVPHEVCTPEPRFDRCRSYAADTTSGGTDHCGNAWLEEIGDRSIHFPSRPGERQHGWEPPREAKPPLGRDTHGPAGGMGYAELCVTCDSRTDELRSLGNGVVPATAERAFRCLSEELFNEPATI
jgi:DNA (cytosine-5)-methyltransferase 1